MNFGTFYFDSYDTSSYGFIFAEFILNFFQNMIRPNLRSNPSTSTNASGGGSLSPPINGCGGPRLPKTSQTFLSCTSSHHNYTSWHHDYTSSHQNYIKLSNLLSYYPVLLSVNIEGFVLPLMTKTSSKAIVVSAEVEVVVVIVLPIVTIVVGYLRHTS